MHRLDPAAVRDVLRYFVDHPHAADDLEGIARWRLTGDAVRRKVDETHRALIWLVERNYLRLTRTTGPAPVFSLNPDKVQDASSLLAAGDSRPADDENAS